MSTKSPEFVLNRLAWILCNTLYGVTRLPPSCPKKQGGLLQRLQPTAFQPCITISLHSMGILSLSPSLSLKRKSGLLLIMFRQIDWLTGADSKSPWELHSVLSACRVRNYGFSLSLCEMADTKGPGITSGYLEAPLLHLLLLHSLTKCTCAHLHLKHSPKKDRFLCSCWSWMSAVIRFLSFGELHWIFPEEDKWISGAVINFLLSPWKDVHPVAIAQL